MMNCKFCQRPTLHGLYSRWDENEFTCFHCNVEFIVNKRTGKKKQIYAFSNWSQKIVMDEATNTTTNMNGQKYLGVWWDINPKDITQFLAKLDKLKAFL